MKKLNKKMENLGNMIDSGIYVLDFNTHIKIGRSKSIDTRVKQYNGYRDEN